LHSGR